MDQKKFPALPLALGVLFTLCFLLLIVLVRTVDVAAIGPAGTSIGLSHLNGAYRDWAGFRSTWYQISKWLGVLGFVVVAGFALLGLWQWIRRRSLWKVDKLLFALAFLYLAVAALYFLFELVVVNYRPVLMPGDLAPEASFPSSHTLLACTIFGSAFWVIAAYLRRRALKIAAWIVCGALLVGTVGGRLLSGVHWLTDILGGILLSAALISFFLVLKNRLEAAEK